MKRQCCCGWCCIRLWHSFGSKATRHAAWLLVSDTSFKIVDRYATRAPRVLFFGGRFTEQRCSHPVGIIIIIDKAVAVDNGGGEGIIGFFASDQRQDRDTSREDGLGGGGGEGFGTESAFLGHVFFLGR